MQQYTRHELVLTMTLAIGQVKNWSTEYMCILIHKEN